MKQIFTFILICLFLGACSKEKTAAKKIEGTWELVSMKLYDLEAVLHYPTSTGTFKAEKISDNEFNFTMQLSFNYDNNLYQENDSGKFSFTNKSKSMLMEILPNDSVYTQNIGIFTKTDIELQLFDTYGFKRMYTFRKKS